MKELCFSRPRTPSFVEDPPRAFPDPATFRSWSGSRRSITLRGFPRGRDPLRARSAEGPSGFSRTTPLDEFCNPQRPTSTSTSSTDPARVDRKRRRLRPFERRRPRCRPEPRVPRCGFPRLHRSSETAMRFPLLRRPPGHPRRHVPTVERSGRSLAGPRWPRLSFPHHPAKGDVLRPAGCLPPSCLGLATPAARLRDATENSLARTCSEEDAVRRERLLDLPASPDLDGSSGARGSAS